MRANKKQNAYIRRLARYLKPYWLPLLAALLLIVIVAVLTALAPIIEGKITTQLSADVKAMTDGIEGAGVDFTFILGIIGVLAIIYAANAGGAIAYNFFLTNAIQNAMFDLRNAVEKKISKLPISYFDKHPVGDILSRISNDVDTISNALQQSLAQIINAVLMLSFAITMMFIINPLMAVIAVFIIPISILISQFIVKKSQKLFQNQQNALGKLNGTVQEKYTGFNEIKLYGKQEDSIAEFKAVNQDLCENGFKAQFMSGLMSPLVAFVTYLGIGIIAVVGAINAISGVITVGNLQAFIRYVWQVNQPLSQVTQLSSSMQSAYAAITRVFEFLDEAEEVPDAADSKKVKQVRGNVSFENVKFGYSEDKILIDQLNAEVKSGQMVAIVGPTGVGKTTLINLLMRFYDVTDGSIKIDGVDIRDMKREDLRSMFAMVLQDTWLFSGTINENLRYGRDGATQDEIIAAAKVANVHHFIKTLPDGYNMKLNEEASNISQGEKQLLTIARAVLSDPAILILDEATSSIDTRLELMLQKAMQNIMQGRTSFVIAHRLSTIRSADLILVMNKGTIAEQGTHEELMELGGFYEKLYNSQFAHQEGNTAS
ncbi:ABC transporter ATP-binding protein [Paenibacillus marinisediminis]